MGRPDTVTNAGVPPCQANPAMKYKLDRMKRLCVHAALFFPEVRGRQHPTRLTSRVSGPGQLATPADKKPLVPWCTPQEAVPK